jgi:isocitrate/isopropylmalate dehydrogenase
MVGERTIRTPDMGGTATTRQVADEVIRVIRMLQT